MVITYEGVEMIKITHGNTTIALNPVSKQSKFKGSSFGADIALVSLNDPDTNGIENVTRKDKEPFVISGPGEYEVEGLFIKGFSTKSTHNNRERINTIYKFEVDNIQIAYLGALGESELSANIKEGIGDVDVIFVPIGGEGVLTAEEAYKLAIKREPSVIIPIHFGSVGEKSALADFLHEGGFEKLKGVDKLTLKKKDVGLLKGDIVVLNPQN